MKEWADRYAGKFDDGWDAYRQRVFGGPRKGLDPKRLVSLTDRDERDEGALGRPSPRTRGRFNAG